MALAIKKRILKHIKARFARLGILAAVLTSLLLMTGIASAQPKIEWSVSLGGGQDDFAHAVIQASDGGYVIVGETGSFGAGGQDIWLVKLDSDANEQWAQTFGGPLDDIGYDVQQTADGGYIVVGETHSFGTGSISKSDYWLIKIDPFGKEEWNQIYGNVELQGGRDLATTDVAHGVRQTSDFGYILTGSSEDRLSQDIWLVKTDSAGKIQWDSQFGGDLDDNAFGVLETADGGYVTAGKTDSFSAGGSDYWLIKTDSIGEEEWTNTFGGKYNDEARAVVQTMDGGYAIGGFSWSFGSGLSDFWLVKTDNGGQEEWNRTYGGVPRDAAHSLQQTGDGGYVMAGWSESFPGGDHFWVLKTDPFGNKQWDDTYGRSSGARAVRQAADQGFVITGWTGPLGGIRDIWVVKTLSEDSMRVDATGPVFVLENTGPAHITSAAVGFNVPGSASPHRFYYRGRFLEANNPLPPGSFACTSALPNVASGAHLVLDQINSFGSGFIDPVTTLQSAPKVTIDAAGISFNLSHEGVQGGRITGRYSFVSQSPCEKAQPLPGPTIPTGLTVTTSATEPATLDLDWNDNAEARIAGYRVYVSLAPIGPYEPIKPLVTDSQYSESDLTEGGNYYYTVTAVDDKGRESAQHTAIKGVPSDLIPPAAPSGLRLALSDQDNRVATLNWSNNSDRDLQGYRIFRRDGDGPLEAIGDVGNLSSYTDQNLPHRGSFTYVVTALDQAGNESEHSNIAPPDLDFFGTVIGIELSAQGSGLLTIKTTDGNVEAEVVTETSVRLPQQVDASIVDLARGDDVAVTLIRQLNRLVADKVFLIPGKTVNRHVSGYVTDLVPGEITIRPTGRDQYPITFLLSPAVEIKFHQGTTELKLGSYVIISAVSEPRTGELSASASEINVTTGRAPSQNGQQTKDPTVLANLNGIFQYIEPSNGNFILSGTEVTLDAFTQMAGGLVAGEAVEVEAELRPDGSLVARKVERDSGTGEIDEQTILEGPFHGIAEISGQWLIGGTGVTVDHRTHTDGLPYPRQRVKVKALLQPDRSLLAREIENRTRRELPVELEEITILEGPFAGIDDEGNWIVGGLGVAVDSITSLDGSPAVGHRVAVDAFIRNGHLVARSVSAVQQADHATVLEVIVQGNIDSILADGSMVVDGIHVLLSNLTELVTNPIIGGEVEIKALLNSNGTLVAKVIDAAVPENETGETRANPVNIEGKIQTVNDDGSLLVNGIRIVTSALSDIEGDIQPRAAVQIRGILQRNGSVLARDIRAEGRRLTEGETEAKFEGVIERVFLNDKGNVGTFVVDGVTLAVEDLTSLEVDIKAGTSVVVKTIVKDGLFLAVTVQPKLTNLTTQRPEVEVQGIIEAIERDDTGSVVSVFINGIEVEVGPQSRINGSLEVGEAIELKGIIRDGGLVADEVEGEDSSFFGNRPSKFKLEGVIEKVRINADGNIAELTVNGERIDIEALTLIKGVLESDRRVAVEGIVRNGTLLAATVVQDTPDVGRSTEEVDSKR